jgi:hypothetical protein
MSIPVTQRVAFRCRVLFSLPIVGAGITLGIIDLIVPREQAASVLAKIAAAPVTLGADVIAAYYHLALAAVLVIVVCLTSIWWSLNWLITDGLKMLRANERSLLWGGVAIAIAMPILLLLTQLTLLPDCSKLAIDDCVTSTLFQFTIKRVYLAKFAFVWDADSLACIVFVAYLLGAVIVATTVGTASSSPLSAGRTEEQFDRMKVLNTVLFLTTVVLLAAMITAKSRFNVGLATLGAPVIDKSPNLAFLAYQTTASAIMAYWATVLSLSLALIYLPGVYLLSRSSDFKVAGPLASLFGPGGPNFSTLLKAAAIISPPVINKLTELLSAAPTGT